MSAPEPTENDERPVTRGQIEALTRAVEHLAATNTWRRIGTIALSVGLTALLVLSVSNVLLYHQVSSQAACVRDYANQNSARTNALSPLSAQQLAAIDRAFQSLTITDPADRAQAFTRAQRDELAAAKAYRDKFGTTPLPDAPGLSC